MFANAACEVTVERSRLWQPLEVVLLPTVRALVVLANVSAVVLSPFVAVCSNKHHWMGSVRGGA